MVNTNKGRVAIGQVADHPAEELAQSLSEPEAPFQKGCWESLPFLQLKEWQSLTGNDQHSCSAKNHAPYHDREQPAIEFYH